MCRDLRGGHRFKGALVLRGCKSCGSRAEKKGRRGGRESDLGEHDGVSCLCYCYTVLVCVPSRSPDARGKSAGSTADSIAATTAVIQKGLSNKEIQPVREG